MENVTQVECGKEHKRVDENMSRTETRLSSHSDRITSVEEALIKLTTMVDQIGKKSIFDKMLIVSVFMMGIVLLVVVLGPELTGRFVGGAVK